MLWLLLLPLAGAVAGEFSCQEEGFFPHPTDCSQFYRCYDLFGEGDFQQSLFRCPGGTLFDPQQGKVEIDWQMEIVSPAY